MSRYSSYLDSARNMLAEYNGEQPFASFAKKYFSRQKKFGATDRRQISQCCYSFFRLGKSFSEMPVEDRILNGLFLSGEHPSEILAALRPPWNEMMGFSLAEKFSFLHYDQSAATVFPWIDELSKGIDWDAFTNSFFIQPDLFLRIRPGFEKIVKQKLLEGGISFRPISADCLALPNSSKVDGLIEVDKEAVIQDWGSQRIGEFFPVESMGPHPVVWDCCAGSGGKSILVYDRIQGAILTVSDIRKSILANLVQRFKSAGIHKYKSVTANLARPFTKLPVDNFDFVLADVPCTGSGTWSRTPEQLYYFEKNKISEYAALQKQIVSNVMPHLRSGGYFLYITCSVFYEENEAITSYIMENFSIELLKKGIIEGYSIKADTMFAALLRKK